MNAVLSLNVPITAHAFNAARDQLAVCPNTNEIHIYAKSGSDWKQVHVLKDHDKLVTGLSWAPQTNRLVSCSQDRNAYVWNFDAQTGVWAPTLVLLRLTRSATAVSWSPNETKFAVASGARTIAVCQFDEDQNWWTAKHIKKPIRSTILSLDWHPNGVLLAAGSADMKARVFSAYLKEVDQKPEPTVWGSKLPFNTVCGEFASPSGGWVHGVAFSPSGNALAFASHDSTITVVYPSGSEQAPQAVYNIRVPSLPFLSLIFIDENSLVAGGHDYEPILFTGDAEKGWQLAKSLDDPAQRASTTTNRVVSGGGVGRLNNEAFNRFRAADSRGISSSAGAGNSGAAVGSGNLAKLGGERNTAHQNTITSLKAYTGNGTAEITKVSSSGLDGRVFVWNTAGLASGMAKLSVN